MVVYYVICTIWCVSITLGSALEIGSQRRASIYLPTFLTNVPTYLPPTKTSAQLSFSSFLLFVSFLAVPKKKRSLPNNKHVLFQTHHAAHPDGSLRPSSAQPSPAQRKPDPTRTRPSFSFKLDPVASKRGGYRRFGGCAVLHHVSWDWD